jgi:isopenicillin N synthase-like dioxygenase
MPTAEYFAQCPPFPEDTDVVDLPRISLGSLRSDATEGGKLLTACREWGFFLLQLDSCDNGDALLKDAETMFNLTEELFSLDQATLDKFAYDAPRDLTG